MYVVIIEMQSLIKFKKKHCFIINLYWIVLLFIYIAKNNVDIQKIKILIKIRQL